MKKILTMITALLVVLLIVSCGTIHTDNSSTPTGDSSSSSVAGTPDKENDKEENTPLTLYIEEKANEFYPMIDCGRYEGTEFARIDINTYEYRIIDNYDELCELTALGAGYSSTLYNESVILALHTYRICDKFEAVGFYDFNFDGKQASIKSVRTEQSTSREGEIVRETVYLQIPKALIENSETALVGGVIDVKEEKIEFLPMAEIPLDGLASVPNSPYLLEPDEIDSFLESNNISDRPLWGIKEEYKIFLLAYDANTPKPLGYNVLSSDTGNLKIERVSMSDSQLSKSATLELVAIPKSMLASSSYEGAGLTKRELTCKEFSNRKTIVKTVVVDSQSCEYYDFLNLGIYYYDSELPNGYAYHIITSLEELREYVENPYLDSTFFQNNYVVVLRLNGYNPTTTIGIRKLECTNNALTVYMDTGITINRDELHNEFELLDKEQEYMGNGSFQSEYCYLSIPKTHIDIGVVGNNIGSVALEVSDLGGVVGYRTTVYEVKKEYNPQINTAWVIVDGADMQAFMAETGVDIRHLMKKGKFIFAYYGRAAYETKFIKCLSNEDNLYVDMSQLHGNTEQNERLFVIQLSLDLLNCTSKEITVHVTRHDQLYAKMLDAADKIITIQDSFHASHYEDHNFKKAPENEITVLENQEDYEAFLSEHTSIELYPVVSFDEWNIIAYYQYEPCTGCDDHTTFGNVRVGDRVMYIDKRVEGHMGGAAMNPTIYFIAVEKAHFEGGIDTIYFIEKHYATDWDDEYPGYDYIESEHLTLTFTTSDGLSAIPDFSWKLITSKQELDLLYEKYTRNVEYGVLDNVFDSSVVLAICYKEGYNMLAYGGFKDFTVKNNTIYITKYYPQYKHGEDEDIVVNGFACTVLHLVVVERCFIPEEITDVVVFMEL